MKLIAHRGNTNGSNISRENSPEYIDEALKYYDAEIDLRLINELLYLGHDTPDYQISLEWLIIRRDKLWIHCKNSEAMEFCLRHNLHCFWHNVDDYTITSHGYVWAYPGKENVGDKCILVMPELHYSLDRAKQLIKYGVCSDYVDGFKS